MKLNFVRSSRLGAFYSNAALKISADGKLLLSSVRSSIVIYNTQTKEFSHLGYEFERPLKDFAISFDNSLLLCLLDNSQCLIFDLFRRMLTNKINFKECEAIAFSPSEHVLAASSGRQLQLWRLADTQSFPKLSLSCSLTPTRETLKSICWSSDGQYILLLSVDSAIRIVASQSGRVYHIPKKRSTAIIGASVFTKGPTLSCIVIFQDNVGFSFTFLAEADDEPQCHEMELKCSSADKSWISNASFDPCTRILALGFTNGNFSVFRVNELLQPDLLHSLSLASTEVTSISISSFLPLIAIGSSSQNLLAIWDWSSECYLLKQQFNSPSSSISFCPFDYNILAVGDHTGSLNFFNAQTGFILSKYTPENPSPIVSVCFSSKKHRAIFATNSDGRFLAFDTVKNKFFRNIDIGESLSPVLALSPSGDLAIVSTSQSWIVKVVDIQRGSVIDSFSGHAGPISSLGFDPLGTYIWSSSWDKTIRIWNLFSATKPPRLLGHNSDVVCALLRPDGRELASATLDGMVYFWSMVDESEADPTEGFLLRSVNFLDLIRSSKKHSNKPFGHITSMKYSVDSAYLFVSGKFPFIAIFDPIYCTLIKKLYLPPSWKVGSSCLDVSFDSACVALSHGNQILTFYQDSASLTFDPSDLELDVSPEAVYSLFKEGLFNRALCIAIRLNIYEIVKYLLQKIPRRSIPSVSRDLPLKVVLSVLKFLCILSKESPLVDQFMDWLIFILDFHAINIRIVSDVQTQSSLRILFKLLNDYHRSLSDISYYALFALGQ